MNLILLGPEDFVDGTSRVRLTGRRLEHVRRVHRARVGDTLRVGMLNGRLGTSRIARLDSEALEMDVALDHDPPPTLPVTLLLALPRPKILVRALHAATAMGVKRIVLMETWRVDKSYWQSPALDPPRLREQLMLGLEQARDTVLPDVRVERRFKPFVEDRLPALIAGTHALVAHPPASEPCPCEIAGPATLAIGPEGGFTDYEVGMLQHAGFAAGRLGERILRVEQAVPALLSRMTGDHSCPASRVQRDEERSESMAR